MPMIPISRTWKPSDLESCRQLRARVALCCVVGGAFAGILGWVLL